MNDPNAHPSGTFVEEADDWFSALDEPRRSDFLDQIRSLPLTQMLRLPPPKTGKIPFGHEFRVLRRFVAGESVQFEPSAFWKLYRGNATERERLLHAALVLNEALPRRVWEDTLGQSTVGTWCDSGLLLESDAGLRSRFCVFSIEGVTLLGDPQESNLLRRVIIGQDSFRMGSFMMQRELGHPGRYLDVGPGSGVILLVVGRYCDERVGLDINHRAVQISRLNAELNETPCQIELDDAIRNGAAYGSFDLVTWNTPFVFLPEECKDTHYDAYGGDLGIEVLLNFLEVLPDLMKEDGRAYLAACGPIYPNGDNPLEERLKEVADRHSLAIREHITQSNWHGTYRYFQEAQGIRRFEHSFLEIGRGRGRLERVEAPMGVRIVDRVREQASRAWK